MKTLNLLSTVLANAAAAKARPLSVPVSVEALRLCMSLLCQVQRTLPAAPLTGRQRQSLAGYLYQEGPLIVDLVEQAVRGEPALFAGYADADSLHARQLLARALAALHRVLQDLCTRVLDLHVRCQAEVVSEVTALLRDVRAAARQPRRAASPDAASTPEWDRADALRHAELILRSWQKRARRPARG